MAALEDAIALSRARIDQRSRETRLLAAAAQLLRAVLRGCFLHRRARHFAATSTLRIVRPVAFGWSVTQSRYGSPAQKRGDVPNIKSRVVPITSLRTASTSGRS